MMDCVAFHYQKPKKNLQEIIDKVKAKDAQIKLLFAGMQIPPNMGQTYGAEFRNMFVELAEKKFDGPDPISSGRRWR